MRRALEHQASLVQHLERLPCSQVSTGHNDMLILDFGTLQSTRHDEQVGSITLGIECPWRIDAPEVGVIGWHDDEQDIVDMATVLIDAAVSSTSVRRPGFDLMLQFSNDHTLRIFPDARSYFFDELAGSALPWRLSGTLVEIASRSSALPD